MAYLTELHFSRDKGERWVNLGAELMIIGKLRRRTKINLLIYLIYNCMPRI